MVQLAIKGHPTRGKEVIQLLEMLGGKNTFHRVGTEYGLIYYLDDKNSICQMQINDYNPCSNYTIFTLEEFEEKFPYKIGDKVITQFNNVYKINEIMWDNKEIVYALTDGNSITCWYSTQELQPYKEENYCQVVSNDTSSNGVNTSASSINEETMEEKEPEPKAPILSNRYDYAEGKCGYVIPDGYEFDYIKEGFQTEIILKPKQPQYPKDYEECCEVLGIEEDLWFVYEDIDGNHINPACISNYRIRRLDLYHNFEKLNICRDAYWKIAGKQLGLGKPWEPDWSDTSQSKHSIWFNNEGICTKSNRFSYAIQHILTFPTPEMRNAFYENFRELIEDCKELL